MYGRKLSNTDTTYYENKNQNLIYIYIIDLNDLFFLNYENNINIF